MKIDLKQYEKLLNEGKLDLILKGEAGSRGISIGDAKLGPDVSNIKNNIKTGDIIVVESTEPPDVPYLIKCGGIVTDTGGKVSHAAIFSTYYNIPCVAGTGTVVLRPSKDGYADESVRYKDGEKVELHTPVVAHYGESWVTADNGKAMTVTDYQKLREYPEIQVFKEYDWKYIRGFDKKVRGVPTEFGGKPSEEYNNARLYVKPELLISPLARGGCFERHREWLFDTNLFWSHERSALGVSLTWRFSLGSETPADSKQILHEKLSDLRKRVATIPTMSVSEIPNYVGNLDKELKQLENLQFE